MADSTQLFFKQALRKQFLIYARRNLKDYDLFLAEIAARDIEHFDEPRFINIATFGDTLAGIADCIVLFPESVGSFAEAGYFSTHDGVRKKTLIANPLRFFSDASFLNDGPIALINSHSAFRPSIPISGIKNPRFAKIKERIQKKIPPKTSRTLKFSDYKDYSLKERFLILLHVIWLMWVCDIDSINFVMNTIFSHYDADEARNLLSALLACGYIVRIQDEEEYFMASHVRPKYLDFTSVDLLDVRVAIRDHYRRYNPTFDDLAKKMSP